MNEESGRAKQAAGAASSSGQVEQARLWAYPKSVDLDAAKESMQDAGWIPIEAADCKTCSSPDRGSCSTRSPCISDKNTIFAVRTSGSVTVTQGRIWTYDNSMVLGSAGPRNIDLALRSRRDAGWVDVAAADCLTCTGADRGTCTSLDCFSQRYVVFSVRIQ